VDFSPFAQSTYGYYCTGARLIAYAIVPQPGSGLGGFILEPIRFIVELKQVGSGRGTTLPYSATLHLPKLQATGDLPYL
jgi:hypothetical protein